MNVIPSDLLSKSDELKVAKVIVAAQAANVVQPGSLKKVNHWVMYLATTMDRTAVLVDMCPSGTTGIKDKKGFEGVLIVKQLADSVTRDFLSSGIVKSIDVSVNGDVTVKDIVSVIQDNACERYDFNSLGIGCRFWISTVLKLLQDRGIVAGISEALTAMSTAWKAGGTLPLCQPIEQGTFHDDDVQS